MDLSQTFPLPDREQLLAEYVGKSLKDVPIPSAILDLSKLKKNCELMLDATKQFGRMVLPFRAHVKTHKTSELTKLQVGPDCKDVRLICSTISELEHLQPLIKEYQQNGASVNVLYGVPPGPSHVPRLTKFLQNNGSGTLALMIDNPAQLPVITQIYNQTKTPVGVFLKTDSGYHRAGLAPTSTTMNSLVAETLSLESQSHLYLIGFYSHNSLSYGGNSPYEAMDNLTTEIKACREAARTNTPPGYLKSRTTPLVISCGASPTALSMQNLQKGPPEAMMAMSFQAKTLRSNICAPLLDNIQFEIHAGVYPTLDMQQIAAWSRSPDLLPDDVEDAIAFTVLSEVCSVYPTRTENPEALINAGCIALAREPCKSYRGHGVITSWNMPAEYDAYDKKNRIIVDRVSQEHGILQWQDRDKKEELPVEYGQRVRIWPNHACITGSHFGWYLIVDGGDEVVDVWVRWRGW